MRGDLRKNVLSGEERYGGEYHPTFILHKSEIIIKRKKTLIVLRLGISAICVLLDIKRT